MIQKIKKIFFLICILIIIFFLNSPNIYAFSINDLNGDAPDISTDKMNDTMKNVIQIISTVGSVLSVIVLIVLGIKYMMGSVEERAEYKRTLMPYFLGAGILFSASTIASIIYNLAIKI